MGITIENRYVNGKYLAANPDWDSADAPWKASLVAGILNKHAISPASIADVGCGSGDVLANLQLQFPSATLTGFDISPQLDKFWSKHRGITFERSDFLQTKQRFDVLLMLDVFEHVRDPFTFLEQARSIARQFIFHIPLDMSALSVARGVPLMRQREGVGHLHFYTKDLALKTLTECGYVTIDWQYTNAYATLSTHRTWKTLLAALPRQLAGAIAKDFAVRVLGGETLIVLARPGPT
jgi:SAM-dependent methyltransferase